MIELFDLDGLSRLAASFDPQKLLWVNQQHIQAAPAETLVPLLAAELEAQGLDPANCPPLELAVEALRERSQTLLEMAERAQCYYEELEEFDPKSARAHLKSGAREALIALVDALATLEDWTEESTQAAVESVAERLDLKLGKVAQPLRVALTGQAASPGTGVTLLLVGRDRTLKRIDRAVAYIDCERSGD